MKTYNLKEVLLTLRLYRSKDLQLTSVFKNVVRPMI